MKLAEAIRTNMNEIATILSEEQGKTLNDAQKSIVRGADVIQNMVSAPSLLAGSLCNNVGAGIHATSQREPLGVCAGITPFNFPVRVFLSLYYLCVQSVYRAAQ